MAVIKIKSAVTRIKRRLVNKGFEVRGCVGGRRVKGVTWGYVQIGRASCRERVSSPV